MSSLVALLLTAVALGPDGALLEGGEVVGLTIRADRIYAATGRGLLVFDGEFHRLGGWNSPGLAPSVAVDSFIFVADGERGLAILDPDRMQPVRTVTVPGDCRSVRVAAPFVIVGTDSGIFRFRGEAEPALDRTVPIPGGVGRFEVNGEWVYAIGPSGLTVVDLRDTSAATSTIPLSNPVDLGLTGENLYVASDSGLTLFSLAHPAAPSQLKNFIPPGPVQSLAADHPYLYLATADKKIYILENRANQMLRPVRTVSTDAAGLELALGDGFLVAGSSAGIDRWAVANPTGAVATGSFRFDTPGVVSDVAPLGKNAAAVGSGSGLWLFDPAHKTVIKRLPALRASDVVATSGDTAVFVIDANYGALGFDLPKPDEPVRNYMNSSGRNGTAAVVVKDRLIVAGPKAFHEYEICPCKALSDKVVLTLPAPAFDAAKVDRRLYVALGDSGILAVDSAKTFRIPIVCHRMLFQSAVLYVLDRNFGLRVYAADQFENPKLLAELKLPGTPRDLLRYKNNLYVATGASGISIVGIAFPATPKIVGSYDTPGEALRLARVGARLLVADRYSLEILKLPE